jgi:selenocysteine lyase/cysteine desulfurase
LNHAGASPSPPGVNDRIKQHLHLEELVGGYAAQNLVSVGGTGGSYDVHIDNGTNDDDSHYHEKSSIDSLPAVYATIAQLLHAKSSDNIALVESATVGWTRAFYSMVHYQHKRTTMLSKKKHTRTATIDGDDDMPVDVIDGNDQPNVILISEAEYAANVVAACQWARDHPDDWTVLVLPSTRVSSNNTQDKNLDYSSGIVDVDVFDRMLEGTYKYKRKKYTNQQQQHRRLHKDEHEYVFLNPSKISIVAITHVPTNSGIVNPVEEIGDRISAFNNRQHPSEHSGKYGIMYLVDACQSVGQMDISVEKIKCHALVATGRKYLRGPRGTGFLYVSDDVVHDLTPSHMDHYGVPVTKVPLLQASMNHMDNMRNDTLMMPVEDLLEFAPRYGAKRFEFWESNIAARLGLGEAVHFALRKGLKNIESQIKELSSYFREKLALVSRVRINHERTSSCGIVAFHCLDVESKLVKETLWQNGFEVSVVPATSTPFDSSQTSVPDLVRASVSYTNTRADLDEFYSCLVRILQDSQVQLCTLLESDETVEEENYTK